MAVDVPPQCQTSIRKVFTGYQELVEELERLRSPLQGRIRVFRGQRKDFGKMLPTGLRGNPIRSEAVWWLYSMHVAQNILSSAGVEQPVSDLDMLAFGVQAVAQHYGPGSRFLDVTYSLEVALWFALHVSEQFDAVMVPSDPSRLLFEPDLIKYQTCTRHHPCETGWLCIFDVPQWDREMLPPHGALIDLRAKDAPQVLASSERIRVQQACLLAADPNVNGGDLASFYACPPIPVARPMVGVSRLDMPTDEMFPGPSRDPNRGQVYY